MVNIIQNLFIQSNAIFDTFLHGDILKIFLHFFLQKNHDLCHSKEMEILHN